MTEDDDDGAESRSQHGNCRRGAHHSPGRDRPQPHRPRRRMGGYGRLAVHRSVTVCPLIVRESASTTDPKALRVPYPFAVMLLPARPPSSVTTRTPLWGGNLTCSPLVRRRPSTSPGGLTRNRATVPLTVRGLRASLR